MLVVFKLVLLFQPQTYHTIHNIGTLRVQRTEKVHSVSRPIRHNINATTAFKCSYTTMAKIIAAAFVGNGVTVNGRSYRQWAIVAEGENTPIRTIDGALLMPLMMKGVVDFTDVKLVAKALVGLEVEVVENESGYKELKFEEKPEEKPKSKK